MRPRLLLIPLLVAPIFFSASGTAALEPAEPQGAAAPNAAAWSALQSRLRVGPTYVELEDGTLTRVEHQMMAVLAALDMARARPDDGPALRAHARDLWNRSMQAFDAQYGFFAVSLPPPDQQVCIEAETNGWALLATASLRSEAPSDAALDTIGNELRAMLQDLLAAGSHRGKGPCLADEGAVPFDQRPVALLGLMAWRDAAADASLDPVVRNELKTVMGRNLRDKAFLSKDEKDGTYRTAPNAQLLIAITDQVRAENDSALRATRDDLAEFLMTVLIQDQGEIAVPVDLQVGSPSPNAIPGSGIEMLWSAAAVEAYGREQPDKVVPGLAGRLLEAFYRTYWDAARGGFVSAARLVTFEDNCLAVVLTTGPRLFSVTRNPGHVALVVRTHGGPGVITNNLLTVRFALASGPDLADKTVLIAPRELAPFEVDSSQALRLSRIIGGQPRPELEAPVLVPGRTPLLRFTSQLGPTPAFFTLDGPSPTVLQGSDVQKAIVVTLANRATVPIELASLQLDLEVTNVTVQTLLLNGNPLIPADVRDRVVTESLRVPHLRVVVANVNLPPGDSTLQISFSD
ncbi:MAG: hypothetical protein HYT80_11655, partial [Euryarchaeota archaeon]|nr:hypothetical protein [Euryarchaeota archaeon]